MTQKVTQSDVSGAASKMFSMEELLRDGQASVEESNGMLIENNFKSDQDLISEALEALKRKFMTNYPHPALERLQAAFRNSD